MTSKDAGAMSCSFTFIRVSSHWMCMTIQSNTLPSSSSISFPRRAVAWRLQNTFEPSAACRHLGMLMTIMVLMFDDADLTQLVPHRRAWCS